jgi:hypothetical protein
VLEWDRIFTNDGVTYRFEDGDLAVVPVMVWHDFFLIVHVKVQLGQVRGSVIVDSGVVVFGGGRS